MTHCGPTLLFLKRDRRINRKDAGTHGMFMRCFVESQLPQSATLCRHHEQPHDVSVTPSVSHLQSSTPPLIQWLQALFAPLLTEGGAAV